MEKLCFGGSKHKNRFAHFLSKYVRDVHKKHNTVQYSKVQVYRTCYFSPVHSWYVALQYRCTEPFISHLYADSTLHCRTGVQNQLFLTCTQPLRHSGDLYRAQHSPRKTSDDLNFNNKVIMVTDWIPFLSSRLTWWPHSPSWLSPHWHCKSIWRDSLLNTVFTCPIKEEILCWTQLLVQ